MTQTRSAAGRIGLKVGAGQVVEQDIEAGLEQGGPALREV